MGGMSRSQALESHGDKFKSLLRHLLSCGLQVRNSAFLSLGFLSLHMGTEGNEEMPIVDVASGSDSQTRLQHLGVGPDPPRRMEVGT